MGNHGQKMGVCARWPVSRVLYPWFPTGDGHSSGTSVAGRLSRLTRAATRKCVSLPKGRPPPLFSLAPGGVYRAASVAGRAVRSYRTLSPLPAVFRGTGAGGLLSVALSLGSPPPDVIRHRTSVEPGLSSPGDTPGSGRPAIWRGRNVGWMAPRVKGVLWDGIAQVERKSM